MVDMFDFGRAEDPLRRRIFGQFAFPILDDVVDGAAGRFFAIRYASHSSVAVLDEMGRSPLAFHGHRWILDRNLGAEGVAHNPYACRVIRACLGRSTRVHTRRALRPVPEALHLASAGRSARRADRQLDGSRALFARRRAGCEAASTRGALDTSNT